MTRAFDTDGYDDPMKDAAWRAFYESYDDNNKGQLPLSAAHRKTARRKFEEWWKLNYE